MGTLVNNKLPIRYSNYCDLDLIDKMLLEMNNEDKKYLFYDNDNFPITLLELKNDVIKGKCLLFGNDKKTIGFVSYSLDNNDYLFIPEIFVPSVYRKQSFEPLLNVFNYLKMYSRPIRFNIHKENNRMEKIATFLKAKVLKEDDKYITYVID